MRIIVDADACPGIPLITSLAMKYNVPLSLYADDTHELHNEYADVFIVSKGFQSVDMVIINKITKNDILITQDYGLAALALGKHAYVINPKGKIYSNDNIDYLMEMRYLSSVARKQDKHIKGPKKRTESDNQLLITNLEKLIIEAKKNE